jgi:hypothetical protein
MSIKLVGTTVRETVDYFLGVKAGSRGAKKPPRKPKEGGGETPAPTEPIGELANERLRIWARLLVSVLVIGGGTGLLVAGSPQTQQAGAGFIGLVLGYWLR